MSLLIKLEVFISNFYGGALVASTNEKKQELNLFNEIKRNYRLFFSFVEQRHIKIRIMFTEYNATMKRRKAQ